MSGGSASGRHAQPRTLPAPASDLPYVSAVDALRAFAERSLSPVELLDALIARVEQVEPQVNALAEKLFAQARAAALEAERRYGGSGDPPPRALEGLPVAVKEAMPLAGHLTSEGLLRPLDASPATHTAWSISRVRSAGGIVHARTTTSELCCMPMSHAVRWGITRNPWDLRMSVGGSSGGSAAALAAGISTLALGSDIGGSIRAPACLTGVVGFKPPHGRVPIEPPAGLDPWLHVGPMARSVADAALLANVLAGPHPGDRTSLPAAPPIPGRFESLAGMRIVCCQRPGDLPVEERVAANAEATAQALRDAGARVESVEIDWRLDEVKQAMWGRGDMSRARSVLALHRESPGAVSPYTVQCMERSLAGSEAVSPERRTLLEARIRETLDAVLARFDAVLIPTMGVACMRAGEDYAEQPLLVDGRPLEHFCDAALTPMLNIASACPVVAVPSGLTSIGCDSNADAEAGRVPTGVQVIARPFEDGAAFRVAAAIESARPLTIGSQMAVRP